MRTRHRPIQPILRIPTNLTRHKRVKFNNTRSRTFGYKQTTYPHDYFQSRNEHSALRAARKEGLLENDPNMKSGPYSRTFRRKIAKSANKRLIQELLRSLKVNEEEGGNNANDEGV